MPQKKRQNRFQAIGAIFPIRPNALLAINCDFKTLFNRQTVRIF